MTYTMTLWQIFLYLKRWSYGATILLWVPRNRCTRRTKTHSSRSRKLVRSSSCCVDSSITQESSHTLFLLVIRCPRVEFTATHSDLRRVTVIMTAKLYYREMVEVNSWYQSVISSRESISLVLCGLFLLLTLRRKTPDWHTAHAPTIVLASEECSALERIWDFTNHWVVTWLNPIIVGWLLVESRLLHTLSRIRFWVSQV